MEHFKSHLAVVYFERLKGFFFSLLLPPNFWPLISLHVLEPSNPPLNELVERSAHT
jgi:hypothetical protein